jgi:hypothetical protein
MDNLHSVLRNIRGETKSARRDHLSVFREFLGHLDRIGKKPRGQGTRRKSRNAGKRK